MANKATVIEIIGESCLVRQTKRWRTTEPTRIENVLLFPERVAAERNDFRDDGKANR